jgi:single-stranded DNA-binding protein
MIQLIATGNISSSRFSEVKGTPVLNFTIGTNRKTKINGEEVELTDWTGAVIWGNRAEKLKDHITTGQKVLIRGRPETTAYLKKDGTAACELTVHVEELEFLTPKKKAA